MNELQFDVMINDRFICTMRMSYCSLFPIEEHEIRSFVESRRPTLKGKKYNIEF